MLVTDIRHLTEGSPKLPAPALKLRTFLGHIIRAATAQNEALTGTGIPCRKLVAKKPCPGLIWVKRIDVPASLIGWSCDACKDSGEIRGFRNSWYDLSSHKSSSGLARDAEDTMLDAEVTYSEYKALITGDLVPYDRDSMRLIYSAYAHDEGVVITGAEGDLDVLRDAIAADANHEKSRARRKLVDSIFTKLSRTLDLTLEQRELAQH